jgi:flagellar biogenesis protein FliO
MSMLRTLSGLAVSLRAPVCAFLAGLICGPALAGAAAAGADAAQGPHPRRAAAEPIAAAGPSPETTQPSTRPTPASRSAPTSAPGSGFLGSGQPRPLVTKPEGSTAGMTWALLASLLVVLVLGALVFVVFKRLLPRLGVKVGRRIRVLETSYLGSRKAVHLLQVGSQRFLIGSTRDRITMLSEVTLAFLEDEQADGDRRAHE